MELNLQFIPPTCTAVIHEELHLKFTSELSNELHAAILGASGKGYEIYEHQREHSNGKPAFTVKAPKTEHLVALIKAIAEHIEVVVKNSGAVPNLKELCAVDS